MTNVTAATDTAAPRMRAIAEELGDFTTSTRVIPFALLAIAIGVVAAFVAWALLQLIGFFTNLFFFGRWSTTLVSPATNHLGVYAMFVPVIGALVIGVMARYGSERIRGHGIPEAIEIDLDRRQPRAAAARHLEAALVGDLDRLGRTVRRRGTDHHDGRRVRLADRAVLPSHERRAKDAARRRSCGRYVGDVRLAYPDEPLRAVVYRMAETSFTRMPVVERSDPRKLVGMVALEDLLKARTRALDEERRRERILRVHIPFAVKRSA
jgi:hypothetical protein